MVYPKFVVKLNAARDELVIRTEVQDRFRVWAQVVDAYKPNGRGMTEYSDRVFDFDQGGGEGAVAPAEHRIGHCKGLHQLCECCSEDLCHCIVSV